MNTKTTSMGVRKMDETRKPIKTVQSDAICKDAKNSAIYKSKKRGHINKRGSSAAKKIQKLQS